MSEPTSPDDAVDGSSLDEAQTDDLNRAAAPADATWPPPGSPQPPRRPRRRLRLLIAAAAAFAVVAAFLGVAISQDFWQSHGTTAAHMQPFGGGGPQAPGSSGFHDPDGAGPGGADGLPFGGTGGSSTSTGTGGPSDVSSIAARVDPALVDINIGGFQGAQGAATGVVLTANGLVLTNNHVVDGATRITATDVGNGRTYTAKVLGYDRSHDIALIRLQGASGLQTARIGDSSAVKVGQPVVAIGNAGGAGGTPSVAGGAIVALNRQVIAADPSTGTSEQLHGLIETNANIQPGDSGGPLVTTSGQVVGIDSVGSSGYSTRSTGGGFAVPSNVAMSIVGQIKRHESSAHVHVGRTAFLGVALSGGAGQGGFGQRPPAGQPSSGAVIAGVVPGAPAAHAGLRAGDVIVSLDGQRVNSSAALRSLLGTHRPGNRVQIVWLDRSGSQHMSTVRLASGPAA